MALNPTDHDRAHDLAFIYLYVAHGTDHHLSDRELDAVVNRIHGRWEDSSVQSARDIVMAALSTYDASPNPLTDVTRAMMSLRQDLDPSQRTAIVDDLVRIGRADGVLLERERNIIASIAETWGIEVQFEAAGSEYEDHETIGVLHDLAFIYLVLAHSTDSELSEKEEQVILQKLRYWQPRHSESDTRRVLEAARRRYALGPDETALASSVTAVRSALPEEQRRTVLEDLVQIANADGFFLDNEEDMINHLMQAWELSAAANFPVKAGRKDRHS